ncbi:MAG: hypothetical protein EKK48_09920 [Candidatus Melainabacteria bacterium]|nr:MAG: hypothetical protein EKK48_09920 [Candidatus Melainabacteria bacterium]
MSADRITYDKKGKFFVFNGQYGYDGSVVVDRGVAFVQEPFDSKAKYHRLTARVVGQVIAAALMGGTTRVQFDSVTLSVNYLTQMLGFVGKHGWFSDLLSSTEDHAFDPNHPTPGGFVGEAQRLQKEAASLEQYARQARIAHRDDEAKQAESQAAELRATARRLLTQQ